MNRIVLAGLFSVFASLSAMAGVAFPAAADLPALDALPDPLVADDGVIADAESWAAQRGRIHDLVLHYEYGFAPPAPDAVRVEGATSQSVLEGVATLHTFTMRIGPGDGVAVGCGYYVPTAGAGPHPVIVAVDPVFDAHVLPTAKQVIERGYAFAGFRYLDVAPDVPERTGGVYPLYPAYDWGTLAAWAWGCSRLIDHLSTLETIDATRIAVTGHSRCGKAALLCGALDERVGLTAPHCSGAGGAGSHRMQGAKSESLALITDPDRFHYWFSPRLRDFAGQEDRLPFDQHFVLALVAPRALVCLEADEDLWANPSGARQMAAAALPVYRLLDAADRVGFYLRKGGHDPTPESWTALLDYADFIWKSRPLSESFERLP